MSRLGLSYISCWPRAHVTMVIASRFDLPPSVGVYEHRARALVIVEAWLEVEAARRLAAQSWAVAAWSFQLFSHCAGSVDQPPPPVRSRGRPEGRTELGGDGRIEPPANDPSTTEGRQQRRAFRREVDATTAAGDPAPGEFWRWMRSRSPSESQPAGDLLAAADRNDPN